MPRSPEQPRSWDEPILLLQSAIALEPHAPHFETPPVDLAGIGAATLHGDRTYGYAEDDCGIAYVQGHVRIDRADAFRRAGLVDIGLTIHRFRRRQPLVVRLIMPDAPLVLETVMQPGEDSVDPHPQRRHYALDSGWHLPEHPERSFILFDPGDPTTLTRYRLSLQRG